MFYTISITDKKQLKIPKGWSVHVV
jgi:hypothetical protein